MQESIKELIRSFPKQVVEAIQESKINIEDADQIQNIVLTGMGGSAVAGNIIQDIVDPKMPFVVNKGYDLPGFVSSKTLLIAVSYSGNTEETLNALQIGRRKNAKIVIITSNGKLSETAKKFNLPLINMKKGLIPRFTVIFQIFAILHVLHNCRIISLNKKEIEESVMMLKKDHSTNAKELAKKVIGRIPLIYTSPKLKCIGLYWKQAFNENSKIHSFNAAFPELNHNELVAYSKENEHPFHVIILRDETESQRMNKRIDLTKKIIKNAKVQISEIVLKGDCSLAKACSAIALGASITAELAELDNVDAEKVDIIEDFKKLLSS